MGSPCLFRIALLVAFVVAASLLPSAPTAWAADPIDVGVLLSESSKDFGNGVPPHPYAKTNVAEREQAARQWVLDSPHNLVELSDADLEDPTALATVDVLILPYSWAMNANASLTVRNWVKKGGGLIPILTSPRVFLDGSEWKLWVRELNYEAWEWGPLSEAYQMMFVNDPTLSTWQAVLEPGHPVVSDTLSALSLSSARFTHPTGSGIELVHKYNNNVTSIVEFAALPADHSAYNGFSAAQATHYGSGRIVYYDFPLLDFLTRSALRDIAIGGGHTQSDLADALLDASVEWAANGGGFGSIVPSAVTYGLVNSFGDQITIRQWVEATGNAAVSGHLKARIFDPQGRLLREHRFDDLGVEPGRTHLFNWKLYDNGTETPLVSGKYHIMLEYRYTYPSYSAVAAAEAHVVRGQGRDIPTTSVSVAKSSTSLLGDFDGNGRDDIATFSSTDGTWTVLQSGGSSFSPSIWADFATASGWMNQMVGDFNGDGRDDIAQFHPSNGSWWISRSTGTGFSTTLWADFSTASGWEAVMAGDFNGDGREDIAQFHPSNGTWWISRSTGSGFSTTLWADFSTASGWIKRMGGDFDGDGKDDIAQFHPSNGTWWISRSTGSGFSTALWADFSTATGWEATMVGDFDGDTRSDITQFHPSNGTWWVTRSTGSAFSTELWADFSTASGWEARLVGDFNGDGRDDTGQFHPSNGTWWISRSTGAKFSTGLWADFATTSGWEHRGVGDFNGDGRDDIAQFHAATGNWWISRSTGSTFSTSNWTP